MFKMICEECESVMHWRCTNQITHIAKYKCPICGNVQTGPDTYKEPVAEKKIPNYYHIRNDRWKVTKTINKEKVYVGTYGNEETAKKVVEEMIKCDWNLDMIPTIYDKLNIHKVNRSWVCV